MPSPLQQILQRPDVWRPRDRRSVPGSGGLASGHDALDRALRGGWPAAALSELLVAQPGCGEVQLLLPLLARLGTQQRWQFWINPPFIPYAPALMQHGIDLRQLIILRTGARQAQWAAEQALRNAASGAVLYWPAAGLRYTELRKLQVAAAAEHCCGFIFRNDSEHIRQESSPAVLRLQLCADNADLRVRILKQRGTHGGQTVTLPRAAALQMAPPLSLDDVAVNTGIDTSPPRRFLRPDATAPQPMLWQ